MNKLLVLTQSTEEIVTKHGVLDNLINFCKENPVLTGLVIAVVVITIVLTAVVVAVSKKQNKKKNKK